MSEQAIELVLTGRVQGVGFRPFVYRLAQAHDIAGWVRNRLGQVEIHAEGSAENLHRFRRALISESPAVSAPTIATQRPGAREHRAGFHIVPSQDDGRADIHTPADLAACPDCEAELRDPANRRHGYPFINCTNCGPRYTIIKAMPYDRANTSMARFPLCPACDSEYRSADDRRFHAEPNACAECGPQLRFHDAWQTLNTPEAALQSAIKALQRGKIIAVKGVGGYHLMCDAANELAVTRLRKNKHRPHKPLALMAADLNTVRKLVRLDSPGIEAELSSQARPIILLPKQAHAPVCNEVAPGLQELGVMLPPSPLHSLLCDGVGRALVATSANISGEPVLTDDLEAELRLASIAEGWLQHNREIVRPADDSVRRLIGTRTQAIRLGRGTAPLERSLPTTLAKPVIALGGHLKNTVALAWDNRVVVSPHIGDLSSHRGMQVFQQVITDLQRLYQVQAEQLLCDSHPQYASSRWAREQALPNMEIQHHRAHASALQADVPEQHRDETGLIFTWDGVGLGDDGTLWGGETFLGRPGDWRRVASLRPFHLLGGDRAASEPWRSAAALHWELGEPYPEEDERVRLAHAAWRRGLNRYRTSAVGRLFDAAAGILGLMHSCSFEGQAPMRLEALAEHVASDHHLPWDTHNGLLRIDWAPLFRVLKNRAASREYRAGLFHRLLANTIAAVAVHLRTEQAFTYVGLSGGVFQNRLLSEWTQAALHDAGIPCYRAHSIPANDGGLSYGQIIEYAARPRA